LDVPNHVVSFDSSWPYHQRTQTTCTHMHVCTHAHVCTRTHTHACTHTHTHTDTHLYKYKLIPAYTGFAGCPRNTHTHTHIYIHTYLHTQVLRAVHKLRSTSKKITDMCIRYICIEYKYTNTYRYIRICQCVTSPE